MFSLIVGDLKKYSKCARLVKLLANCQFRKKIILYSKNTDFNDKTHEEIIKEFDVVTVVFNSGNVNKKAIQQIKKNHEISRKIKYVFVVRSIEEVNLIEKLIEEEKLSNVVISPYYCNNYDFFYKYIFLDEKNIKKTKLSMKEILLNKKINRLKYGELSIDPHGNVFSDLNSKKLGNIKIDNFRDMIVKEITKGKCWKLTRRKVMPCKNCVYCDICPPISNYEINIGKYNLCKLRNV